MNEHGRVVRWIASNRFPFPDQTDWPAAYVTITNVDGPVRGVSTANTVLYPDVVIVDGVSQRIAEIGEVITAFPADAAERWATLSAACKRSSTGARSFFVYSPPGLEARVRHILDVHAISFAGVRTFSIDGTGIAITPVITHGDARDHR